MRPKKSVVEIESDALSCWCFLRDLWQTEDHPGVDLSKTELSHQTEPVHGPEWQTDILLFLLIIHSVTKKKIKNQW